MSKVKALGVLVVVCALVFFGGWAWLQLRELKHVNDQLNAELMQAKLEVGKAHTQFGDAQKYIAELEDKLQREIAAHNELVTQYGELLAAYNAHGGGHSDPSDPVIDPVVGTETLLDPGALYVAQGEHELQPFSQPMKYGLSDSRLNINVAVSTMPRGSLKFVPVADIQYDLHLNILAHFAQTITESGAVNNYAELYEVDKDGKRLGKFEITKFEYIVEDLRKPKLRWWAPHIDLAVIAGWSGGVLTGASIGLSPSGYGKTDNDLTVRFPRIGIDITSGIGIDFSPAVFNIADPLPLISNIWIGPFVSATHNRGYGFGLLIGVVM
jgi:hypothetical protein